MTESDPTPDLENVASDTPQSQADEHEPGQQASLGMGVTETAIPDEAHQIAATGGAPTEPAKGPGIKEVRAIDGLLRYAYGRVGRFSIPPTVRDAIANDEVPIVDLRGQINELASQDPLLKVPVRVLAAVDRAHGSLKFRRRCLSAVALALLSNRSLRSVTDLDSALLYQDYGDPAELLGRVARTLLAVDLPMGADGKTLRDADRKELTENGVLAVALYFAIQRDWSDADLAWHLDPVLWAEGYRAARAGKRESTKALLVEAPSGALGTVAHAWRAQVEAAEEHARGADRLRGLADEEREAALRDQRDAEAEVERLRAVVAARDEEIAQLNQAITQEQQARHVQSSHAVDDYENLRTRVLRSIDRQLALLEDGLHALRSGSTQVTEEYLERVIEAFVIHADSLREENSPEEGTR
jgi:hypothetical protein